MKNKLGFTLIELMIAVAIVGILAAIAVPAYLESNQKARRQLARDAMLDIAAKQERYYFRNQSYKEFLDSAKLDSMYPDIAGVYDISVTVTNNGQEYLISAVPDTTGIQATDKCTELTLNHLGEKVGKGDAKDRCWQ